MKWNKDGMPIGRYIDAFLEEWPKDREYVVFGAGRKFEAYYPLAKRFLNIAYVVDNDNAKQGTLVHGLPVKCFSDLLADSKKPKVITSTSNITGLDEMDRQLEEAGYRKNISYTTMKQWLGVHHLVETNTLWLGNVNLMVTTKCSLNCEHCVLLMPYNKRKRHFSASNIAANVDAFFSIYGYVSQLHILGGEPLLHPELPEIIDAISTAHRNRIGRAKIVTNGTLKASHELLNKCVQHDISFILSDYREVITNEGAFEAIVDQLTDAGIPFEISRVFSAKQDWLDPGDPTVVRPDAHGAPETKRKFRECLLDCRLIYDRKLYFCGLGAAMDMAGITKSRDDEFIDLAPASDGRQVARDKRAHLAFDWGYTPRGYLDSCRRCNGFGKSNTLFVPPGLQRRRDR